MNVQSVFVLSVFVLTVFVSTVFVLSVFVLSVFVLTVFVLSVFVLTVFVLSVFVLTVFVLSLFVLTVFVLSVFVLTGVRLYIFCHRLGWGIKTCTSYPIVLLIRVRINESRLYLVFRETTPIYGFKVQKAAILSALIYRYELIICTNKYQLLCIRGTD